MENTEQAVSVAEFPTQEWRTQRSCFQSLRGVLYWPLQSLPSAFNSPYVNSSFPKRGISFKIPSFIWQNESWNLNHWIYWYMLHANLAYEGANSEDIIYSCIVKL
jgi:hypothetical protein